MGASASGGRKRRSSDDARGSGDVKGQRRTAESANGGRKRKGSGDASGRPAKTQAEGCGAFDLSWAAGAGRSESG